MNNKDTKKTTITVADKLIIQVTDIETLLKMTRSDDMADRFLANLELGRRGWSLTEDNRWLAPKN